MNTLRVPKSLQCCTRARSKRSYRFVRRGIVARKLLPVTSKNPQVIRLTACDQQSTVTSKNTISISSVYIGGKYTHTHTHIDTFQSIRVNMKTYIEEYKFTSTKSRIDLLTTRRRGATKTQNASTTYIPHLHCRNVPRRCDVLLLGCYPTYNLTRENTFLICYTMFGW